MSVADAVRAAIARCGREVSLIWDGGTYTFFASIQPRSYDTLTLTKEGQTRYGQTDTRQFVYYGPLEGGGELVGYGTILTMGDQKYRISTCHDFYCGETPVFRWAVAYQLEGGTC